MLGVQTTDNASSTRHYYSGAAAESRPCACLNVQSQFTGPPMDIITKDTDRDFFMSPQEAIEYGLIDAIISKPQLIQSRELLALQS